MPFTLSQIQRIQSNLKLWKKYPPCSLESDSKSVMDFVFYYANPKNKTAANKFVESLLSGPTGYLLRRCFDKIYAIPANLTDAQDVYFDGKGNCAPCALFYNTFYSEAFSHVIFLALDLNT